MKLVGRSFWAFLSKYWGTERGLSAMLVFLVLALFVGAPLVAMGLVGPFLFDLLFTLFLLSGLAAFSNRRMLAFATLSFAVVTLIVRWAGYLLPGTAIGIWDDVLSILALSILAGLVLILVFREGPITSHRIQGAIAVYLLMGLIWMSAYMLVYQTIPGAFRFPEDGLSGLRFKHNLAYFSFVTLTTVGYGDITPVHPLARSLAMAEALVGQLYPAILIARLVSMELATRQERRRQK
jgi:Ion channel